MHIYNAIQSFLVFKLKNLFVQVMKLVSFGANLLVGLAYCYYWRTEYIIFWNIASQTCGLSFISPTTNKNECANLRISDCPYLYSSFCVSMITFTYLFNPASCSDSDSVRITTTCVSGCPPSDDYCLIPWVYQLTCFQYHLLFYEMIIITHSKERIHEIYARLLAMSFYAIHFMSIISRTECSYDIL